MSKEHLRMTINLGTAAKSSRQPSLQKGLHFLTILTLPVYIFISIFAWNTHNQGLTLFSLFIFTPILIFLIFLEQYLVTRGLRAEVANLRKSLSSIAPLIDADLGMFDVKLADSIRQTLDTTNSPELTAFGGLLGYGRIFGIRESTAPVLEQSKTARQQLYFLFSNVANSLGTSSWVETFEELGSILAHLSSISTTNLSNQPLDRISSKEFARFLRKRANEIYDCRLWNPSSYVHKYLQNFRDTFSKEFSPWAALILFWLNAQLFSFAYRSVDEMSGLFATEYQLLAHRLLVLADAIEHEDWDKVSEVLIASHKPNKNVLRSGLRQPT